MDDFRRQELVVARHCRRGELFSDLAAAAAVVTIFVLMTAAWMNDYDILWGAVPLCVAGTASIAARRREYRKANEAQEHLAEVARRRDTEPEFSVTLPCSCVTIWTKEDPDCTGQPHYVNQLLVSVDCPAHLSQLIRTNKWIKEMRDETDAGPV